MQFDLKLVEVKNKIKWKSVTYIRYTVLYAYIVKFTLVCINYKSASLCMRVHVC